MNLPNADYGRPKSDKKLTFHISDEENTMLYSPADYTGNRWFGTWNKLINMPSMLDSESREKYYNVWQAKLRAELGIETFPQCFDQCCGQNDFGAGLSSDEKNCMRECYYKRVSSIEDLHIMMQQKAAYETTKNMREARV